MTFVDSLLFPQENACHLCGRYGSAVCAQCLAELERLRVSGGISRALPEFSGCVSAFWHKDLARTLVHQLKYRHDPMMAGVMGQRMALAFAPLGLRVDAVLPVPAHPERVAERGFNQAALLAQTVADCIALPCELSALVRTRSTAPQVGHSRAQRLRAMRGAFLVPNPAQVRGRSFLLVDDVVTTGATAIACCTALRHAGASDVFLLTFCRA